MTPRERLARIEAIGEQDRQRRQAIADVLSPAGGPSCRSCRHWDGWEGGMADCSNAVVRASGGRNRIQGGGLRTDQGLCGPEALLWQLRRTPIGLWRRFMELLRGNAA